MKYNRRLNDTIDKIIMYQEENNADFFEKTENEFLDILSERLLDELEKVKKNNSDLLPVFNVKFHQYHDNGYQQLENLENADKIGLLADDYAIYAYRATTDIGRYYYDVSWDYRKYIESIKTKTGENEFSKTLKR